MIWTLLKAIISAAVIAPSPRCPADFGRIDGEIQRRERLGGMLRYYYRDAA
jgi:hypothetical protein